MKILIGILVILLGGALLIGGCAFSGYNKVVTLDEEVEQAWAQVENQLQRRYDLLPNLVETVKGYASHEKEIFTEIAQARTKYFQPNQSRSSKIKAAVGLEGVLSRLLVLQEKYPDLKAQQSFLGLQDELAGAENRLSVERKRFNDTVGSLNKHIRAFPGKMFAGWAGVEKAEYFEVTTPQAKEVPKVNFGGESQKE